MQIKSINGNSFSQGQCGTKAQAPKRAQGTIEYLVIVGIVVVLSLVVVGIISSTGSGSTSTISSTTGKISQVSGGISITEAVVDNDRNGLVSLTNNSGSTLIITKISVDGTDTNYLSGVSLISGSSKMFGLSDVGSVCSCADAVGLKKTCNLVVYGQSEYGLDKKYSVSITVECVADATAKDVNTVVTPQPPVVPPAPVYTSPVVLLSSPINQTLKYTNPTTFTYAVTDDYGIYDCNLLLNGQVVATNSVAPFNSFSLDVNLGRYDWNVNCGNINSKQGSSRSDLNIFTNFVSTGYFFLKYDWPSTNIYKLSTTDGHLIATYNAPFSYHHLSFNPDENTIWIPRQGGSATAKINATTGVTIFNNATGCNDSYCGTLGKNGIFYNNGGWYSKTVCRTNTSGTSLGNIVGETALTDICSVAVDSNQYVWLTGRVIEKIDLSNSSHVLDIVYPSTTAEEIGLDSLGNLWYHSQPYWGQDTNQKLYKYNSSGSPVTNFDLNVARITFDNNANIYAIGHRKLTKISSVTNQVVWEITSSDFNTGENPRAGPIFFEPFEDYGFIYVSFVSSRYINKYDSRNGSLLQILDIGSNLGASPCVRLCDPNGNLFFSVSEKRK